MISFLDWNEVPYQQMKHQWTVSMLVFTVSLEKLFEFTRCPQKNESFSSETNLLVKLTVSVSTDWNRSLAFHMYSPSCKLISFFSYQNTLQLSFLCRQVANCHIGSSSYFTQTWIMKHRTWIRNSAVSLLTLLRISKKRF